MGGKMWEPGKNTSTRTDPERDSNVYSMCRKTSVDSLSAVSDPAPPTPHHHHHHTHTVSVIDVLFKPFLNIEHIKNLTKPLPENRKSITSLEWLLPFCILWAPFSEFMWLFWGFCFIFCIFWCSFHRLLYFQSLCPFTPVPCTIKLTFLQSDHQPQAL